MRNATLALVVMGTVVWLAIMYMITLQAIVSWVMQ